ncbi:MAG: hypothetical protein C0467_06020 [Planctomycetaceae bacterium]|nr:hypothetical protein [Planctomycetaceae bacterium]
MPPDSLRAAVRRVVARGTWLGVPDVLEIIGGEIPDDLARKTFDRLHRAGGRDPGSDPARLDLGRVRVVREQLQRLVGDGKAEAEGEGDERRYRMLQGDVMTTPAKPKRVWLPIERIVRDPALQMRSLTNGLTDPSTVERYREAIDDGEEFPQLDVVTDSDDPTDSDATNWLTDGFQRIAAYELAGKASVECIVYRGTYREALLRALPANAKHGRPRSPEDQRRSLATLLDAPDLLKRVRTAAKEDGISGTIRALARACGVSNGLVTKVLKERNLVVTRKGDLEKVNPPAPAPPPPKPADEDPPADASPARASDAQEESEAEEAEAESYTAPAHRTRSEAEILCDAVAAIRERLERYAESVEGRWLLGKPGPMGWPFVKDDSEKLKAIFGSAGDAVPQYQSAVEKREKIATAEGAALMRGKPEQLPRGCAESEWLMALWKALSDHAILLNRSKG